MPTRFHQELAGLEETVWRIPELKWNDGFTEAQTKKANNLSPSPVVTFNVVASFLTVIALGFFGYSTVLYFQLSGLVLALLIVLLLASFVYTLFVYEQEIFRKKLKVVATVVDNEIHPTVRRKQRNHARHGASSGENRGYVQVTPFRMLCQYTHPNGSTVQCVPQHFRLRSFPSPEDVMRFMEAQAPGGQCILWVHPRHPLRATLGFTPRKLYPWGNWVIAGVIVTAVVMLLFTLINGELFFLNWK